MSAIPEIVDLTINMEADDPDGEMTRFAAFVKKFSPDNVTDNEDGSVTITCTEDILLALIERFKSGQGEVS